MYMYVSHSMSKIKTIYTVTITIEPLSQSLLVPSTHSPSVHVYIQMLTFHPHAKYHLVTQVQRLYNNNRGTVKGGSGHESNYSAVP